MGAVELLREQFNSHVAVREKRPGVLQLVAPLFHEDGDMMDIFLDYTATHNKRDIMASKMDGGSRGCFPVDLALSRRRV